MVTTINASTTEALVIFKKLADVIMFKSISAESLVSTNTHNTSAVSFKSSPQIDDSNWKALKRLSLPAGKLLVSSDHARRGGDSRGRRDTFTVCEDAERETNIVRINVGGTIFNTTKETLRRYPDTLLGALTPRTPWFNRRKREYFFDRNPTIFSFVLDLYRTKELHLPRNCCGNAALRELDFWQVPAIWVSECCWSNIHDAIEDRRVHQDLKVSGNHNTAGQKSTSLNACRKRLWLWLYDSNLQSTVYTIWNNLIALVIVTTLVLFFVESQTETLPHDYYTMYLAPNASHKGSADIPPRRNYAIKLADYILLGVLILEFTLKMAVCPNLKRFFMNLVNVTYGISLAASCLGHIGESIDEQKDKWTSETSLDSIYTFVRTMNFLRVVRFFELLDRNASLHVMWIATKSCKTELFLLLVVFTVLATFFGSLAYYFELYSSEAMQGLVGMEDSGLTISLYWAIITMTTVGYGDITPQTVAGRVIGALCSISGVIVLAMPVAVLTESFQQYNLRLKIRREKRKRQDDFFRKMPISGVVIMPDAFSL